MFAASCANRLYVWPVINRRVGPAVRYPKPHELPDNVINIQHIMPAGCYIVSDRLFLSNRDLACHELHIGAAVQIVNKHTKIDDCIVQSISPILLIISSIF